VKKISLENHQVDLLIECLKFCKGELETGLAGKAHAMAGRYTYRRINEILAKLSPEDKTK
jgi:hypothetical protein